MNNNICNNIKEVDKLNQTFKFTLVLILILFFLGGIYFIIYENYYLGIGLIGGPILILFYLFLEYFFKKNI